MLKSIIKFLSVGLLITIQLISVFVFGLVVKLFIILHIFSYESLLNIFCDAFTLLKGQRAFNPTIMLASVVCGAFLSGYYVEKKFPELMTPKEIKILCLYASFIWMLIGFCIIYITYFNITLAFWLLFAGSVIFYYFLTCHFLNRGVQYKQKGNTLLSLNDKYN